MVPADPLVLRARRVLDPADGRYATGVAVVVASGSITAVTSDPPTDCETLDLGDRTILPGLIDCHTHILLHCNELTQGPLSYQDDYYYQLMQEYPSHRAAHGVRAMRIALEHGFTTMRDVDTEGAAYDDVGLRDAVNEGIVPGPRMQVAGPGLSPTGSFPITHFRPGWTFPMGVQIADGPDECRRAVREQVSYGVDWIKVYCSYGHGLRETRNGYVELGPNWTVDELTAIVGEAHTRGVKVAAHCSSVSGTEMAVDCGVDSIEHAYSIPLELAQRMAAKGIFSCPTLTGTAHNALGRADHQQAAWQHVEQSQLDALSNCRKAGVRIVLGTDVGAVNFPWTEVNQAIELQYQVKGGMSPLEAIRSATSVAAELMSLDGIVGAVSAGASADLIAAQGDPLSDVGALMEVDFVMQGGKVVRALVR